MANDYYSRLSEMNPGELADGLAIEQELDAVARGFAKLPTPHRDGNGFEGPTRVGTPVETTDAVNLGTLEELNLPIYRKQVVAEDWNSLDTSGIYDVVGATGSNKPDAYNYGVLIVQAFRGVVMQLYYPDRNTTCAIAKRCRESSSASTWTAWDYVESKANATVKATCLVNTVGTGAPHETVSSALPANIVNNSRYVLRNPFGNNTPVEVWAEVFWNNRWARTGGIYAIHVSTGGGYGTLASYVQGEGIVVQTGRNFVCTVAPDAMGGHGGTTGTITSAPCRVFVCRIDD